MEVIGCVSLFMFAAAAFVMWGVISPRSQWETLGRWQYKNPEANEPSDAAFMTTRITSAFSVLVLVGFGIFFLASKDDWEADQQREEYEECLDEVANDGEESLLSPQEWCEDKSPSP